MEAVLVLSECLWVLICIVKCTILLAEFIVCLFAHFNEEKVLYASLNSKKKY